MLLCGCAPLTACCAAVLPPPSPRSIGAGKQAPQQQSISSNPKLHHPSEAAQLSQAIKAVEVGHSWLLVAARLLSETLSGRRSLRLIERRHDKGADAIRSLLQAQREGSAQPGEQTSAPAGHQVEAHARHGRVGRAYDELQVTDRQLRGRAGKEPLA